MSKEKELYPIKYQMEKLEAELKAKKKECIKELIEESAKSFYDELQNNNKEDFSLRDINMYFKDLACRVQEIIQE